MRCLAERYIDYNRDLFVCFVDYEKAFDRLNWKKLMEVLADIGVDWKDRRLITALYMGQTAVVRVSHEVTEPSEIGRGVRQGCLLSPLLFNIYAEAMMRKALYGLDEGVKVGGEYAKAVRYDDDQAMRTSTEIGLQKIINETKRVLKSYGIKINIKQTKMMKIGRTPSNVEIMVDGKILQQMEAIKCFRSVLTDDGRSEKNIRIRIGMAKSAFYEMEVLISGDMGQQLKKRLIKTFE